MKTFWEMFLRAPEGDGGGGSGDGGAVGDGGTKEPGGGGGTPPAGQPGGDGQGAAPYRPDGLPDHLFGKSDKETIDHLFKAHAGFRDAAAKHEPPPADANGYAFEWSDSVKPYAADFGEDKFFAGVKEDALKAGLSNKQANAFLDGVMGRMISMQLVDAPVDVEAEKLKLAPADAKDLTAPERDAAIQRRVTNNIAFVDSLAAKGFDKDAAAALGAELAAFPELNQLVEFIRDSGVGPGLGGGGGGGITLADVEKRQADPRNQFGKPTYDATYAAETDRQWKALFPG